MAADGVFTGLDPGLRTSVIGFLMIVSGIVVSDLKK